MRTKKVFWIFAILQGFTLAAIIFLLFNALNMISEIEVIKLDLQIVLSLYFPLFLVIIEYIIYSKD